MARAKSIRNQLQAAQASFVGPSAAGDWQIVMDLSVSGDEPPASAPVQGARPGMAAQARSMSASDADYIAGTLRPKSGCPSSFAKCMRFGLVELACHACTLLGLSPHTPHVRYAATSSGAASHTGSAGSAPTSPSPTYSTESCSYINLCSLTRAPSFQQLPTYAGSESISLGILPAARSAL